MVAIISILSSSRFTIAVEIETLEATISHLKEEISTVELRIGELHSNKEKPIATAAVKQEGVVEDTMSWQCHTSALLIRVLYVCLWWTEAELRARREKLNQQLSSMQQNIQDLKFKIEELKEEGIAHGTSDFHIV